MQTPLIQKLLKADPTALSTVNRFNAVLTQVQPKHKFYWLQRIFSTILNLSLTEVPKPLTYDLTVTYAPDERRLKSLVVSPLLPAGLYMTKVYADNQLLYVADAPAYVKPGQRLTWNLPG